MSDAAALDVVEIDAFDLGCTPDMPTVKRPGRYLIRFVNDSSDHQQMAFSDGFTMSANPHESATATITVPWAGVTFLCSVPGHAQAGTNGMIMIGGTGDSTGAP